MSFNIALALLIVGLTAILQCHSLPLEDEWTSFKKTYSKQYKDISEEKERMQHFLAAKETIRLHNEAYARGETSFEMGINHLSDLSPAEFKKMNGFRPSLAPKNDKAVEWVEPKDVELPASLDWRKAGLVSEVKNQGGCGSCWAFSATGALEGQHAKVTGNIVELSEQQLMDCSKENHGCGGGLPVLAFNYVKKNKGIDTEFSYPYVGRNTTCHFDDQTVGATDTGYVLLPAGNMKALKIAVATIGPISVAVDASDFNYYKKGVLKAKKCSPSSLDHGVLLVGYGTDPKEGDYWIVKNSWGPKWGEDGYVRMARDGTNICGIAQMASYPLVYA